MSISLHYSARRRQTLSEKERQAVDALMATYSVDDQIEHWNQTGAGPNWESFPLYSHPLDGPDTILEGATKLPNNSQDGFWMGVLHLCGALSELRRLLPDANWAVHIDGHDIHWDEKQQAYDPSV